jgi:hypothetical protein
MPDNKLEIDLNNIIQNAIGEKPFSVEKNFDNVMMQKAADIISGKREEISANYSMSQEDGDIDTEVSDEELDDILTDIDNEEETDEVIDDSQDESEDQAEPDTEEETDVEEA